MRWTCFCSPFLVINYSFICLILFADFCYSQNSESSDAEPVHVEAVERVPFETGQQNDHSLHSEKLASENEPSSTLLPPGVTGRPTVVEYRFGNSDNQSKGHAGPEPKSAARFFKNSLLIASSTLGTLLLTVLLS